MPNDTDETRIRLGAIEARIALLELRFGNAIDMFPIIADQIGQIDSNITARCLQLRNSSAALTAAMEAGFARIEALIAAGGGR
jgi:hypothetical protein